MKLDIVSVSIFVLCVLLFALATAVFITYFIRIKIPQYIGGSVSLHKEHEVLLKLEKAGLDDDLSQKIIESKGNALAKKMIEAVRTALYTFLPDLIRDLKLDWVDDRINEDNFPVQPEDGDLQKEYKVFDFKPSISPKDAAVKMSEEGYRHATVREFLWWGKGYWNRRDFVLAAGQIFSNSRSSFSYVMHLCVTGRGCVLALAPFTTELCGRRFLGVK